MQKLQQLLILAYSVFIRFIRKNNSCLFCFILLYSGIFLEGIFFNEIQYALDYVSVTRSHDGFKVEMTFAWLLPLVVLEAPPLAPPLAPSSASADEALVPLSPRAPRNGRPREARA